jgi:CheY-like chemotaxis protein
MTPNTENTILVVEDQDDAREALTEFLEVNGYAVVGAANGLAALDEIKTKKPKLILLDLMMPVMDGYTFLDLASQRHLLEDVAVVVTTADQSGKTPDVAAFVDKPIRPEMLMPVIRRFMHNH